MDAKLARIKELIELEEKTDAELEALLGGAAVKEGKPRVCSSCGLEGRNCPQKSLPLARRNVIGVLSWFFGLDPDGRESMLITSTLKSKRTRLRVATRYIKMGVVKFPRTGCEQLLTQLHGFGAKKSDDAVLNPRSCGRRD